MYDEYKEAIKEAKVWPYVKSILQKLEISSKSELNLMQEKYSHINITEVDNCVGWYWIRYYTWENCCLYFYNIRSSKLQI